MSATAAAVSAAMPVTLPFAPCSSPPTAVNGPRTESQRPESQRPESQRPESPRPESQRTESRRTTPWQPTERDRLIFRWVKFEGHTQSWVAQQFELHQSTVSRIVERYERWIAHGGPQSQGALTHDERVRAQHWMTYERNEWILSSALRIAGEMEQALDTSKSVVSHAAAHPGRETLVRTESRLIDRSGIAARFLRLAHRVNMDQLALVAQQPLPALEPLGAEEMAIEETPLCRAPQRAPLPDELPDELPESGVDCQHRDPQGEPPPQWTPDPLGKTPIDETSLDEAPLDEAPLEETPLEEAPIEAAEAMPAVHHRPAAESPLTNYEPVTYDETEPAKNRFPAAYPVASHSPGMAELAFSPAGV